MIGILDSTTNNFASLINIGNRFIIPKFQRDYSWDTEQWDDLWQDIENMITENGDPYHYMGYLVLQTSNTNETKIIDGQQRFTTITFIILAAIKSIQKLMEKGIDPEDNMKRIEELKRKYIGNMDPVSLEYDNILVLNRNNNAYYKDYVVKLGDLKVRNTSYTEKLMKKCFEWYEKRLENKYTSGKEYAQFIENIVFNLYFTIIRVSDEMNAFKVFETLNARGVQLSSSDLLKNYLFSLVDNMSEHPERINILEGKWSVLTNNVKADKLPDFIRYYWNSKNKTVRSNELFKKVRECIKTENQVFELINDMIDYSDIYMALKDSSDELWTGLGDVQENIYLLNIFNLKQPVSMLMSAYKSLSNEDFIRILKDTVIIGFRYSVICGKNPNEVERIYNEIAMQISKEHRYTRDILKRIYVEDDEFNASFETKVFSESSRNNKIIKYILGKIERFKDGLNDITIEGEANTIEHIYPQNPDDSWDDGLYAYTYRLGNLCLLEKNLNKDIKNLPYTEKVKAYCQSSFKTTKRIPELYTEWNQNSVLNRQKQMSVCAKGIWKIDFEVR